MSKNLYLKMSKEQSNKKKIESFILRIIKKLNEGKLFTIQSNKSNKR